MELKRVEPTKHTHSDKRLALNLVALNNKAALCG